MENRKKKVIVIGAGISGLTSGIYALDNDFDVEIYEKHYIAGGLCTGWNRSNLYIDGCAHWIVGTNKNSDFYPLWRHVGAINDNSIIHDTEYFAKYDIGGEIITLYADLKKLEEELLRISPEDKKMINHFVRGIKTYQKIKVPVRKPLDHMNLLELTAFGIRMVGVLPYFIPSMHTSLTDYSKKFKSPILKDLFCNILPDNYNLHSLLYTMRSLSKNDAGVLEGGSRKMAFDIRDNYLNKGGKLYTNSPIKHIYIENNIAKGVVLENGEIKYADYVICTTDAHHTLFNLLDGKYRDHYYEKRFNNLENNPLIQGFQIGFKIKKDLSSFPKMLNFKSKDIKINNFVLDRFSMRNHAFDSSLYKDNISVMTVLFHVDDDVYNYLKNLTRKDYEKEKIRIGMEIREEIKNYLSLNDEEINLIDVATPLTYERYTNAYHGSYMSFLTTKKAKGLMRKGLIKKLKNFALAGQWIMPPGGLPIALFTGKFAVARICKMEKKKFVELDFNTKE